MVQARITSDALWVRQFRWMEINMTGAFLRGVLIAVGLSGVIVTGLSGFAQADPVVPGEEHCVVNVRSDDRLNMREGPSAGAPIVARKRYGDCGIQVTSEIGRAHV